MPRSHVLYFEGLECVKSRRTAESSSARNLSDLASVGPGGLGN